MEDYKRIFDSVFDGMGNSVLRFILKNEDVPFAYCEKALNTRKLDWNCKLAIALRNDCPDEMLVRLCRSMGYKFTDGLVSRYKKRMNRDIPDDAINELMRNKENLSVLVQYCHLSDNLKRKMLDRFIVKCGGHDYCMTQLFFNFLMSQLSVPEDCFDMIDHIVEKYIDKEGISLYRSISKFHLKFLRTPFDESTLDEFFEFSANRPITMFFQIASNPSISDYVSMRLLTQTPEHLLESVKQMLDENEEKRCEYRRRHEDV